MSSLKVSASRFAEAALREILNLLKVEEKQKLACYR
jgi:hypothetical protein